MVSDEWLDQVNKDFRKQNVEPQQRPWEAISRYAQEFQIAVEIGSDTAKKIFAWFEARTGPSATAPVELYEAMFFYDAQFWSVSIPVFFGTVDLDPLESLHEMPDATKIDLTSDTNEFQAYLTHWFNVLEYATDRGGLLKHLNTNSTARDFFSAGDQELTASVSILKQQKHCSRAILSCGLAMESFLKSYIAWKQGLTIKEAKKIGHCLPTALGRALEVGAPEHWRWILPELSVFPAIGKRYTEIETEPERVWQGFFLTQFIAADIIRESPFYTAQN